MYDFESNTVQPSYKPVAGNRLQIINVEVSWHLQSVYLVGKQPDLKELLDQ